MRLVKLKRINAVDNEYVFGRDEEVNLVLINDILFC
jgi:hypothetical protein